MQTILIFSISVIWGTSVMIKQCLQCWAHIELSILEKVLLAIHPCSQPFSSVCHINSSSCLYYSKMSAVAAANLTELEFDYCHIKGRLPDWITEMRSLTKLQVTSCNLADLTQRYNSVSDNIYGFYFYTVCVTDCVFVLDHC